MHAADARLPVASFEPALEFGCDLLLEAHRGHVSTAGADGEVAKFLEALKERAR